MTKEQDAERIIATDNRLDYLTENRDMLLHLKEPVPREKFHSDLEFIYEHSRKSNAGLRPFDVMMMFKTLILQVLYSVRTIGINRAEVKLGLRNLAYNTERFCFLMRQTA